MHTTPNQSPFRSILEEDILPYRETLVKATLAPGMSGRGTLHMAVEQGNTETLALLIEAGSNINNKAENGRTPLAEAAATGRLSCCKILLDAGALVNTTDTWGNTPLSLAKNGGHTKVCNLLHSAGAIEKNIQKHFPPLRAAIRAKHLIGIEVLLSQGQSPTAIDESGQSAIHEAAAFADPAIMLLLLGAGADPNIRDSKGATPLHHAAKTGNFPVLFLLLKHGGNPNIRDQNEDTPLCHARKENSASPGSSSGQLACARLLAEKTRAPLLQPPEINPA